MPGAYSGQQQLIPMAYNLGATIAAGTAEVYPLGTVPSGVPTMHLIDAYHTNGATVASDTTNYSTLTLQKGASTVMATFTNNGTAITADTPVQMTRHATVANRKLAAAGTLKIDRAFTGTGQALTAVAGCLFWFRVGSEDLNDA